MLSINTDDSLSTLVDFLRCQYKKGDSGSIGRLARCYRDGIGVDKDTVRAYQLMMEAAEKGLWWAPREAKLLEFQLKCPLRIDPSSNTVLFSCEHYGAISSMMAIRFTDYPTQEAILLLPNGEDRESISKQLVANNIFNRIIFYDKGKHLKIEDTEQLIEQLQIYYSDLFRSNNVTNLKAIITSSDIINPVATYLYLNDVHYSFLAFSGLYHYHPWLLDSAFKANIVSDSYHKLEKKAGSINGSNSSICDLIYIDTYDDLPEVETPLRKYSLDDWFTNISDDDKDKITKCFGLNQYAIDGAQLFVTGSIGFIENRTKYRGEKCSYVNLILSDLFFNNQKKLVIKPHPNGFQSFNYPKYFPHAEIISKDCPIELFRLLNVHYESLVSTSETAYNKIKDYCDSALYINLYSFLSMIDSIDLIIACILIADKIKISVITQDLFDSSLLNAIASKLTKSKVSFVEDIGGSNCHLINPVKIPDLLPGHFYFSFESIKDFKEVNIKIIDLFDDKDVKIYFYSSTDSLVSKLPQKIVKKFDYSSKQLILKFSK